MGKIWVVLLGLMLTACNLTTEAGLPPTTVPAAPADGTLSLPTTPTPPIFRTATLVGTPALTPLAGGLPPPPNYTPGAAGQMCDVYTTYSGSDPANRLSLRAQPGTSARQVLRLPNHTRVLRVPGSAEVEADGYHWLNIIYVDGQQQRHEGWTARDSYSAGGVRDLSLATLRPTGQQAPC